MYSVFDENGSYQTSCAGRSDFARLRQESGRCGNHAGNPAKRGIEITNDASQADAVIVNTCSFIDTAQEESVDTILESAAVREAGNRGQALVVSGCLPQRFRDELPKPAARSRCFHGIDQVTQVAEIVEQALKRRAEKISNRAGKPKRRGKTPAVASRLAQLDRKKPDPHVEMEGLRGGDKFGKTKMVMAVPATAASAGPLVDVNLRPGYIPDFGTPRFRLTPRHYAYLKIAEGCNHPCSFCIIPRMRGSHRSRPQADLVTEARALVQDGVREINLISQDSTYYGLDLRTNHSRAISSPAKFNAAVQELPEPQPR